jgi:preprotein translocase subunit YajC
MVLLAASSSSSFIIVIWILVFVGIFYFMAIRPQRRQRQKHGDLLSMLKKGDEVITIGGMYGTVKKIGDDYVELEIANRTRVKFLKRSISSIVSEEEVEEEYEEDPADESDEVVDGDAEETEAGDESDAAVDEAADADGEESSTR